MNNYYDIGYPTMFGTCHIGLYQPVFDCFLLTLCNYSEAQVLGLAQEVMLIASSRYNLVAVDLTSAENYCPNIIDNECCENWSVPVDNSFSEIHYHTFLKLRSVQTLLPSNTKNIDIALEKEYLQTVCYYVKYFSHTLLVKNPSFSIKQLLNDTLYLQTSTSQAINCLKHTVMKELHLTQDLDLSKTYIESLILTTLNKHDLIF